MCNNALCMQHDVVVLGGELVKRTPHVVALIFFVSWRSELNGELAE